MYIKREDEQKNSREYLTYFAMAKLPFPLECMMAHAFSFVPQSHFWKG